MMISRLVPYRRLRAAAAVILVGGLLLAPATAYAWLNTDAAWTRLFQYLLAFVSEPGEFEVKITRVSNPLSGTVTIDGISISDQRGAWLTVGRARLEWSPLHLLRGDLTIEDLRLSDAALIRLPETGKPLPQAPPTPAEDPFQLPELPQGLHIENIQIVSGRLGEQVLGQAATFSASGRLIGEEARQDIRLILERTGRGTDRLAFEYLHSEQRRLKVAVSVRSGAGGLLTHALGFGETEAVEVVLEGDGSPDDWNARLAADIGEYAQGSATVAAAWGRTLRVDADGSFTFGSLAPAALRQRGSRIDFVGRTTQLPDGTVALEQGGITAPFAVARLDATLSPARDFLSGEMTWRVTDASAVSSLMDGASIAGASGRIHLKGPLDGLHAEIDADITGVENSTVEAERLVLQGRSRPGGGSGLQFELEAEGTGLSFPDQALASIVGNTLTAQASGSMDMDVGEIALSPFHVEGAAFALSGIAHAGWRSAAVEGEAMLRLPRLDAFTPLAGRPLAGSAEVRLADARATLRGQSSATLTAHSPDLVFDGAPLAPKEGESVEIAVTAALDATGQTLQFSGLRARAGPATLTGEGRTDWRSGTASGEVVFDIERLAALRPWVDLPLQGGARVSVKSRDDSADGTIAGTISATGLGASVSTPAIDRLLGPRPEAAADLRLLPNGEIAIDLRELRAAAGRATGSIRIGEAEALDGNMAVVASELSRLSGLAGVELAGDGRADIALGGTLASPRVDGVIVLQDLVLDDVPVGTVEGEATYSDSGDGTEQLALALTIPRGAAAPGHVRGILRLGGDDDGLSLKVVDVKAYGATVSGSIGLGPDVSESKLVFDIPALAALPPPVVPLAMTGSVQGRAHFGASSDNDAISLSVEGSDIALVAEDGTVVVSVAHADIDAVVRPFAEMPLSTVNIGLRDLTAGERRLAAVSGSASGSPGEVSFELAAETTAEPGGDRLSLTGEAAFPASSWRVRVTDAEGALAGHDLSLEAPFTVRGGPGTLAIELARLHLGDGTLEGRFAQEGQRVEATLDGTRVPLAAIGVADPAWTVRGTATGSVTLETRPGLGSGQMDLRLGEFGLERDALDAEGATMVLTGRWDGARLTGRGEVMGTNSAPLALQMNLPVVAGPDGLPAFPTDGPLTGQLVVNGPLAPLWERLPLPDHLLQGRIDADLALGGTADEPLLTGEAAVRDGSYQHLELGTIVRNLNLRGSSRAGRFLDISLTGTDGGGGSVEGSGRVSIASFGAGGPELQPQATLDLSSFVVVRRDEITARLHGNLSLTQEDGAALLRGRLVAERIEARLLNDLPPSAVELSVIEIRDGQKASERADLDLEEDALPVALDIAIDIPGQMFVRGRGLDSAWKGNLHAGGRESLELTGRLEVDRGAFDLGGKSFGLERGIVTFDGGEKIDPRLDLLARHVSTNISSSISVTGRLSDPALALSSVPAYPEDEVLSRALFNKSPGALTPFEAVTLANSAATLAGIGGGGILSRFRDTLGVDVLRFSGGDGSGGAAVTVGKYVADNVFVGATQGSGKDTSSVTVEVELTDNLSVESDFGVETGSNVGVNWEWRY